MRAGRPVTVQRAARPSWNVITISEPPSSVQAQTSLAVRALNAVLPAPTEIAGELATLLDDSRDPGTRAELINQHPHRSAALLQALVADPRAGERTLDWQAELLSHGELLSSALGAGYLRAQGLDFGWCDARDWLQALPLPNQSAWAGRLCVSCGHLPESGWRARFDAQSPRLLLTQGFIARHADGGTAVLGRGGSDTSAACFGALLGASRVEIWTDVPGMFSANPREVPGARLLTRLDYAEAQEIATTGAKVLHPRAIGPCRDARVPMAILDTARPELPGTTIAAAAETIPGVKAISRRNGIVLVAMESVGMWQQVGVLADVFERFRRHGL